MNMPKILILCTGNSCRSQIAEGFLRSFDDNLEVYSAGTEPVGYIHLNAVRVMKEAGIDISEHYTKHVKELLSENFDYVITVCGGAREVCPVFSGRVRHQVHIGFDDPAKATGTDEEIMAEFRRICDEIKEQFLQLYKNDLKG